MHDKGLVLGLNHGSSTSLFQELGRPQCARSVSVAPTFIDFIDFIFCLSPLRVLVGTVRINMLWLVKIPVIACCTVYLYMPYMDACTCTFLTENLPQMVRIYNGCYEREGERESIYF